MTPRRLNATRCVMAKWEPSPYGLRKLRQEYGEERTELLLAFLDAQMAQQVTPLGPILREIVAKGGIFGMDSSIEMAQVLAHAIGVVRKQTEHKGSTLSTYPALKTAVEWLSLLALPAHPVTELPQHRMPIWDGEAPYADKR